MTDSRIILGPDNSPLLILAHGAGADSLSDFMPYMAEQLASLGVQVWRFDFPYMQKRQQDGKKRPPDRADTLLQAMSQQIDEAGRPCIIAGKSMGGRIASMLAHTPPLQPSVKGCACLGYPFHPLGKPERLRIDHLQSLQVPQLIVQGERDPMGTQTEVAGYTLDAGVQWLWLEDGDHDFKPRKASGLTQQQHWLTAADAVAAFVKQHLGQ